MGSFDAYLDSDSECKDSQMFEQLLSCCPRTVREVYADGVYDSRGCREAIYDRGAKSYIPPPKNGKYHRDGASWREDRQEALACIQALGGGSIGKRIWQKLSGYHRRNLVEMAIFRFKKLFGAHLHGRLKASQSAEIKIKSSIMNRLTQLGMPRSYPVIV